MFNIFLKGISDRVFLVYMICVYEYMFLHILLK